MSDLRGQSAPAEIRFGSGGKIIALVAVLVALGAFAGYGYETGQFKVPHNPVADSDLPTVGAPGH